MTANFPNKLDDALIRPGRIDFKFEFQKTAPVELAQMLKCTQMDNESSCELMNRHRMSYLLK
jgi:ATP-dependent 26S proteasome regulatory subunit